MNYGLAYAVGFHPWEDLAEHPPFAGKLLELVAREEAGEPPYGPALDLGTGSAVWGVRLAQRGWEVTGVDLVEKALARARERIAAAGVEMRLVRGDVTALRAAEVGGGFRLVLDTGTFHGLGAAEQQAMGREVSAVAAADATVLLDCFAPPAARAAAARREPGRGRGGVPGLGGDRRRGRGQRARRARAPVQVRRAVLSSASMRLELTQRFPVPLREGFDYIVDPGNWPAYWPDLDPRAAGLAVAGAGGSRRRRDAAARPPRRAAR